MNRSKRCEQHEHGRPQVDNVDFLVGLVTSERRRKRVRISTFFFPANLVKRLIRASEEKLGVREYLESVRKWTLGPYLLPTGGCLDVVQESIGWVHVGEEFIDAGMLPNSNKVIVKMEWGDFAGGYEVGRDRETACRLHERSGFSSGKQRGLVDDIWVGIRNSTKVGCNRWDVIGGMQIRDLLVKLGKKRLVSTNERERRAHRM